MTGQKGKNSTQGTADRQKRVRPFSPAPPDDATLELARAASRRVQSRETTIRRGFIRLPRDGADELVEGLRPPLAILLRGSRGAMRLRLYLAVLWMAGGGEKKKGHTVTFPARAYAELLGLDDPGGKGQRRVRDALASFADEGLVSIHTRPGHPATVALLREDGSGEPYDRPGNHFTKTAEGETVEVEVGQASAHHFVRLGSEFWTEGWSQVLTAPGIAVLLAMLVVTTNGKKKNQWMSLSERRLFGLSDDTWTRGTTELADFRILIVRRAPVSRDPFDWKRRRNTYSLILERLKSRPDAELPTGEDALADGGTIATADVSPTTKPRSPRAPRSRSGVQRPAAPPTAS